MLPHAGLIGFPAEGVIPWLDGAPGNDMSLSPKIVAGMMERLLVLDGTAVLPGEGSSPLLWGLIEEGGTALDRTHRG